MSLWQRQEEKIRQVRENNRRYREVAFEKYILSKSSPETSLIRMKSDFITKISHLPKHSGVFHSFSQLDGYPALRKSYPKSMQKFVRFMNQNPEPGLSVWIEEKVCENEFWCWKTKQSTFSLHWKAESIN